MASQRKKALCNSKERISETLVDMLAVMTALGRVVICFGHAAN